MADKSAKEYPVAQFAAKIDAINFVAKSFSPPDAPEYSDGPGMRGNRYLDNDRRTKVAQMLDLGVTAEPTLAEAISLMGLMFTTVGDAGAVTWSGYTEYSLAADPTGSTHTLYLDKAALTDRSYGSCYLKAMEWSFSGGDPMGLSLEFTGTAAPGTTELSGSPTGAAMMVSSDLQLLIDSNRYFPRSASIRVDQKIVLDQVNSLYPRLIGAEIPEVTGEFVLGYNSDTQDDLLAHNGDGTEFLIEFKVDNGTGGVGISLPTCNIMPREPEVSDSGMVTLTVPFKAYGATADGLALGYVNAGI